MANKNNISFIRGTWNRSETPEGRVNYRWVCDKDRYGENTAFGIAQGAAKDFHQDGIMRKWRKPEEFKDAFVITLTGVRQADGSYKGDDINAFEESARKVAPMRRILPPVPKGSKDAEQNQYASEIAALAKTPRIEDDAAGALIRAQGWEARDPERVGVWVTNPQDALQIALHLHDKGYMDNRVFRYVLEDVQDREKNKEQDPINLVVDASRVVEGREFVFADEYPPDFWVKKVKGVAAAIPSLPPSADAIEPRKKAERKKTSHPTLPGF